MRKSDGSYTYFVPDVAYHVTKWRARLHAGRSTCRAPTTTARSRACAPACRRSGIGIPAGLSRLRAAQDGDGDEGRRGGEDLQARRQLRHGARPDRRGRARRGALLPRVAQGRHASSCSTSTSRARRREENPVYYVQYAHARICSVLRQAGIASRRGAATLARRRSRRRSTSPYEDALLRRLADFPEVLAPRRASSRRTCVTFYLKELAARIPQLL